MSLLGAFRATRPVLSAALTSAFATQGIHIRRHKPQTPEPKLVSSDEAVKCIQSKNRVFVHSAAAVPQELLRAMVRRHSELEDVEVCHIHIEGPETYQRPEYRKSFKGNNFFVGANSRKAIAEGRADFVPVFLSEIPLLFRRGVLPLDVALISLSPPDRHGYCSLGTSIDVTRSAVECARVVVAQINPHIPRTYGDSLIHLSDLDFVVEHSEPLPQREAAELLEEEKKIGEHIAQLVPNGATLQLGIGSVPDATLRMLGNHKELGIHTEMFSDGIVELVNQGVVTGMHKSVAPGKIVSSFAVGSQKLYDFMHENPTIAMLDCAFVNMPVIIMRNPKVIAINSCIQIDLTGQICADSIGSTIYSGIGGQMDFIRGAALSEGGKPIIAFTSTTSKGVSRIAPFLNEGAGVVTTRAHAHYIVTEYGVANLFGKNLRQRAEALIGIAHPSHRESLTRAAQQRLKYA